MSKFDKTIRDVVIGTCQTEAILIENRHKVSGQDDAEWYRLFEAIHRFNNHYQSNGGLSGELD